MRVLIVGCGYIGRALGESLVAAGHEVHGVRRDPEAVSHLTAAGIRPVLADITDPGQLDRLPAGCDQVILCAAPGGGDVAAYQRTYLEGTRRLLDWLEPRPPERLIYTGSTGVYGQTDGETVDETSPTAPLSSTARILVETEALLLGATRQGRVPAVILRLAGIYGPGRGYWLRQFLDGTARLEGDGSRVLNMIHQEDVVQAVRAALDRGQPGQVYNGVDDEPVTQRTLLEWLAHRLDRPLPPSVPGGNSSLKQRTGSKRVLNRRLRDELKVALRHPTFREGFEAELTRLGRQPARGSASDSQ